MALVASETRVPTSQVPGAQSHQDFAATFLRYVVLLLIFADYFYFILLVPAAT